MNSIARTTILRSATAQKITVGSLAATALLLLAAVGAPDTSASDNQSCYYVPVNEILDDADTNRLSSRSETLRAALDGPGQAYVWTRRNGPAAEEEAAAAEAPTAEAGEEAAEPATKPPVWESLTFPALIVLTDGEPKDISGRIYYTVRENRTDVERVIDFEVKQDQLQPIDAKAFYRAEASHYQGLMRRRIPGAAYFRYLHRQAMLKAGETIDEANPYANAYGSGTSWRNREALEQTCALFSGGRAMAENLQLDRILEIDREQDRTVDVDTIRGISIAEIDWAPLIEGLEPTPDALAKNIPYDQHAVFFPTFNDAVKLADEMKDQGLPILEMSKKTPRDARTFQRYQKQLGLSLDFFARTLGPQVIKSVAITGSDTYFPTGTDVAVLLETNNAEQLAAMLKETVKLKIASDADLAARTEQTDGELASVKYTSFKTPSRDVSSYIAAVDGVVIVTNSKTQLRRLISTSQGAIQTIVQLPEYTFFRDRYKVGAPEETAFVFLSDATIRRWCGPQWRIAASRRMRQAAVLSELQAQCANGLAEGPLTPGPIDTKLPLLDGGRAVRTPHGAMSTVYGTLEFITPIAELPCEKATELERNGYEQWRDRYEGVWRRNFDPIGLRVTIEEDRLATDLTVMPLIADSRYDNFIEFSSGGAFEPTDGDQHEVLLQYMIALNYDSEGFREGRNMLENIEQGLSLSWIGDYFTVFLDPDPIWDELAKRAIEDGSWDGVIFDDPELLSQLPVGVAIDSKNPLQLAVFLTALRAFIEQTAPDLTVWESRKHNDVGYVRIGPNEDSNMWDDDWRSLQLFYSTTGGRLLISLREDVVTRAIDRELAKKSGEQSDAPTKKPEAWLGSNMALYVDKPVLNFAANLAQKPIREAAKSNLPILTEYQLRFPDEDPLALHQRIWGERLVCPGGRFVWDETKQRMTIERTEGQKAPTPFDGIKQADFGVTFENDGLRAKAEVLR